MSAKKYLFVSLSFVLLFCLLLWRGTIIHAAQDETLDSKSTKYKPQPVNAVEAVLEAFDRVPLVALGESHSLQEEHDFITLLIRHPDFATKVNDIVVEFGNARYQEILDQYIAGEDVSLSELRQVWRNTTVSPLNQWDAPMYEQFFATVREVNQQLPKEHRLRVLAGDPPIDWSAASSREDVMRWRFQRDSHYASIVISEVLAKKRKALMIAGVMHFTRRSAAMPGVPVGPSNALQIIEQSYPKSTFVIAPHTGFGDKNCDWEARLSAWNKPSLALTKGTWIGEINPRLIFKDNFMIGTAGSPNPPNPWEGLKLEDLVDAYLYLGKHDELTLAVPSPFIYRDESYFNELNRRNIIMHGRPLDDKTPQFYLFGFPARQQPTPMPPTGIAPVIKTLQRKPPF